MRILLTGGSGMVGQNILNNIQCKNYEILAPSSGELDLLKSDSIDLYLKENKPDLVIHAAGIVGGIEANIQRPIKFLLDNSKISLNLINLAFINNVDNFLNLGSSCMYPKDARNPIKESSILEGKLEPTNEGYALAKIISLKLCEYISSLNQDKKYKTIIPCNLYGKFDNFHPKNSHMIPAAVHKIHQAHVNNKETVEIWGDGLSRREFMLGSSFADFIFFAIKNFDSMPQIMNVGIGHDYNINEYYSKISKVIGYKGKFVHDTSKPVGMKQKLVNIDKLSSFGWSNKVSLEDGIKETYKFYKEMINEI